MSDVKELELIKESIIKPDREEEAKRSLLSRIYKQVREARPRRDRALNGGRLAPLPDCVARGDICPDDMNFTYNAIRVLISRYMSKDESGRFLETPSMVMRRVASGFSSRVDEEELYTRLVEGKFVFNSPTLFNMFSDGARGTLSACYVTPVGDTMEDIMDAATVQAMTFKWGGGQGFSFSELRPRWDVVKGTSGYSSGPLSFMRLYDTVTELVKQGGKRRGANMGIMHVWHPDIYTPGYDSYIALRNLVPIQVRNLIDAFARLIDELKEEGYSVPRQLEDMVKKLSKDGWWTVEDAGFIQAKKPPLQDANLTNFNISVGINDAFMKAVIQDEDWWMINPRFTSDPETGVYRIHYSTSRATGLGRLGYLLKEHPWLLENPYLNIFEDLVGESLPKALEAYRRHAEANGFQPDPSMKNTFAWRIPARKLWNEIVDAAWGGGDPGLYLVDNHTKWNPTPWLGVVVATNPCGEQPLYPFESCNLGSVSVDKYIENGVFDVGSFMRDVELYTEALDAVIDLNRHPDKRQSEANKFTRKIGLGIMGLAVALAKLEMPYDSDEAVAFTLILMAALEAASWKRSWEMASRLGHAPAFECRKYDWRTQTCIEKASPEELAKLHTPALVKAGLVARIDNDWVRVKYHDIAVPEEILDKLTGGSRSRVEHDGTLRLVPRSVLDNVARRVFGIGPDTAEEALKMGVKAVESPRHLLALAVYKPLEAWNTLVEYGRRLGAKAPRNTVTTTIAPTGTISIIAGTSSGVEPFFALVYMRQVTVGTFLEVVREFRRDILELAEEAGAEKQHIEIVYDAVRRRKGSLRWALPSLIDQLEEAGAPEEFIRGVEKLARKYATSMDFPLWYHVAHQAAAQLYVDQAISKTINLPKNAARDDVETTYLLAWLGGLKGVTVYRDESKGQQVIVFGGESAERGGRLLSKRKRKSMILPRKRLKLSEVASDPRARELFEFNMPQDTGSSQSDDAAGDEVVVELTENSTCKTCEK